MERNENILTFLKNKTEFFNIKKKVSSVFVCEQFRSKATCPLAFQLCQCHSYFFHSLKSRHHMTYLCPFPVTVRACQGAGSGFEFENIDDVTGCGCDNRRGQQ